MFPWRQLPPVPQERLSYHCPRPPKLEKAAASVSREGGATDRSFNAVDTRFHLDPLARAVRKKEEQGKSMSLVSVLADVFQPSQPPIHAMNLQYAVASFCDLEFHLLCDLENKRIILKQF